MKTLLFLIFSVIAYAAGSRDCSEANYAACDKKFNVREIPITGVETNRYCKKYLRSLNCQIDLAENCPDSSYAKLLENLESIKMNIFSQFCMKGMGPRTHYLQNAVCVKDVLGRVSDFCEPIDFEGLDEEERCKKVRDEIRCIKKAIKDECDVMAVQVFLESQAPAYELKQARCLKNDELDMDLLYGLE